MAEAGPATNIAWDRPMGFAPTKRTPLAGRRILSSLKNDRGYWLGIHEQRLVGELIRAIRPGDVVYDIGVHRGYLTMIALKCRPLGPHSSWNAPRFRTHPGQ